MQGKRGNGHESDADILPMDAETYLQKRVKEQLAAIIHAGYRI